MAAAREVFSCASGTPSCGDAKRRCRSRIRGAAAGHPCRTGSSPCSDGGPGFRLPDRECQVPRRVVLGPHGGSEDRRPVARACARLDGRRAALLSASRRRRRSARTRHATPCEARALLAAPPVGLCPSWSAPCLCRRWPALCAAGKFERKVRSLSCVRSLTPFPPFPRPTLAQNRLPRPGLAPGQLEGGGRHHRCLCVLLCFFVFSVGERKGLWRPHAGASGRVNRTGMPALRRPRCWATSRVDKTRSTRFLARAAGSKKR